jgi:hypothetical protein
MNKNFSNTYLCVTLSEEERKEERDFCCAEKEIFWVEDIK